MFNRGPVVFLLLCLCLPLLLVACDETQTSGSPGPPPTVPAVSLGAEDVVEIKVFMEPTLTGIFRISPEGFFTYPLLGAIQAEGRTVAELTTLLTEGLADGYLVDPQVQVEVEEFNTRMVSVIGQVRKPGRYPYRNGFSLVQAIAVAGGTTDKAILAYMQVTRTTQEGRKFEVAFRDITLGKQPDFLLVPGDIVVVHESVVK